jgi:HK97 family phage portal protein
MKWFTKSRPARARYPLAFLSGVSGGGVPGGYEAQVRAGYLENPVAQRAVRLVAEGAASVGWDGDGGLIAAELMEAVATALLLHGNAFVERGETATGAVAALYALRPERVTIEAGADGWPSAYVYRAGAAASRVPPERMLHLKAHHPLDDHFGLGCLGAAAGAVALHNAASRWNRALLDNAARPSGALICEAGEDGALSAEQFARLKDELEAGFQGAANAGRPMLIEGGMKWQALSLTPAELDFAGAKAAAAREIALAFGVPPMLLGMPGDNTYANYAEANRALWRLTILPLLTKAERGLSGLLGRTVRFDRESVPSLSADRDALWARVSAADFLDADEKRRLVGVA